jgi:hypothetical protein
MSKTIKEGFLCCVHNDELLEIDEVDISEDMHTLNVSFCKNLRRLPDRAFMQCSRIVALGCTKLHIADAQWLLMRAGGEIVCGHDYARKRREILLRRGMREIERAPRISPQAKLFMRNFYSGKI